MKRQNLDNIIWIPVSSHAIIQLQTFQIYELIILFFKLLYVWFLSIITKVSTNISDVEKIPMMQSSVCGYENKNTTQCYDTFMIIPRNILKFDKMLFPYEWKASELENGLKVMTVLLKAK